MNYATNDHMLICELAKDGMPVNVIAEKMEVMLSDVFAVCAEYGVKFCRKGFIYPAIQELIQKVWGVKQITEHIDCDKNQVYMVRHKLGLKNKCFKSDKPIATRCKMAFKLVTDGMTISEACKSVKLSTRDFNEYKKALAVN